MGQVCAKHNEYYERECRWCEAPEVAGRFEGYDLLPVATIVPLFPMLPSNPTLAAYLGAIEIGHQETEFWMDFINQGYCKADDPNDGHGSLE